MTNYNEFGAIIQKALNKSTIWFTALNALKWFNVAGVLAELVACATVDPKFLGSRSAPAIC